MSCAARPRPLGSRSGGSRSARGHARPTLGRFRLHSHGALVLGLELAASRRDILTAACTDRGGDPGAAEPSGEGADSLRWAHLETREGLVVGNQVDVGMLSPQQACELISMAWRVVHAVEHHVFV